MPSKHLCFEVKSSSNNCQPLMKKTGSSALEQAIKVRKPYTITKQRERWTDDEHAKFLEALKRYGRAWRQIEEHVGTKSAVQIRSHAQKFFTKVVRESVDDNPSGAQNIDIPPPRPKKKPMHPYPRKLGNSPKNSVTEKQEWSSFAKLSVPGQNSSSVQPVSEQDSLSPVSVLSAVRSDTFGSSGSDVINCSSISPASLSEHETGCQSAITSVEEQDESLLLNKSNMEIDMGNDDKEAPAKTLKLFGATVMVASIKNPVQVLEQSAADSFGEESRKSNLCPSMVTPMFYLSHNSQGNSSSTSAADAFPMPWLWAITSHQSFASKQDQSASYIEVSDERGARKDSSTAPDLELSIGDSTFNDRNAAPVMKLRPSETSAFRSLRCASDKPARGFVPYRRCVDDNLEGQGVELCL